MGGKQSGRRPLLTPEVHKRAIAWLRSGAFLFDAARACGVHRATFREWMKRGAEEERRREQGKIPNLKEQRYVDFVRDADVALAEGKAILVARVHSASEKDWRAAAWMLERKFPSQYGQTLRSDVTAKVDVKVSQDLSKLSDDELEALRALVDKVDTSGEGSK